MPSNHLILCHLLLLLPSIFPSIRVFSNESALRIRWPEYWSLSFNISPSSEYSGLISFRMDWLDLLAVQGTWCWTPLWRQPCGGRHQMKGQWHPRASSGNTRRFHTQLDKVRDPLNDSRGKQSSIPGQNTEMGSLSLLQRIFPTQESSWSLLHCRGILYQLS